MDHKFDYIRENYTGKILYTRKVVFSFVKLYLIRKYHIDLDVKRLKEIMYGEMALKVIGVDNMFGTPIDDMIDQSGNLDIGASIFEDHHGAKSGIMHLGYLVHNPAAAIHDLLLYWWRKSHEK